MAIKRLRKWLRNDPPDWYDGDWKNYEYNVEEFRGHYSYGDKKGTLGYYEYPGSWATCKNCKKITRRILKNGEEAGRCEHCGERGYWTY